MGLDKLGKIYLYKYLGTDWMIWSILNIGLGGYCRIIGYFFFYV